MEPGFEPRCYRQCHYAQGHIFSEPITYREDVLGNCGRAGESSPVPFCKENDNLPCKFYHDLPSRLADAIASSSRTIKKSDEKFPTIIVQPLQPRPTINCQAFESQSYQKLPPLKPRKTDYEQSSPKSPPEGIPSCPGTLLGSEPGLARCTEESIMKDFQKNQQPKKREPGELF